MKKTDQMMEAMSLVGEKLLQYSHVSKDYEKAPHNYGLKEAFGIDLMLNHMEMHMLDAINKKPGITAQDLASMFLRTKGSVSQNVKVLAKEGLIIKRENPTNARMNNLYTTQIGRVACENHTRHEQDIYKSLLPALGRYEVEDLERLVEIIDILMQHLQR